MASVNDSLSPLTTGETMRDYKHASRTFVDNNFELQPRYSNLFHVVFEFTAEAATLFNTVDQLEIPILVKSVDLPTYTVDVQTHNQYNRKVQSHHSMSYNPIAVRFHDDAKELIRNMWHKYYIYYNADPTYSLTGNSYTAYDKYSNRVQQQWGLQRGNKRFFKNIKIYSMHNHKFAEYTLINPIITAFNHDSHAYSNGGLMENTMQLAYETVKYATGFVNDVTPRGFTDIHYDVETSDLSNTNTDTEAFINGQTVSVAGQEAKDLFQGNVIGVIKDAEIVYNETRLNTGNVLTDTLSIFANNLLSGKKSTSNILVPVTGLVENVASKYVGSITDGIVKSISGADIGVISSQGKSIQTNNNTAATNTNLNVGYGKKIPNTNGTVSHPNNISDALTTFRNLVGSKK
jgi:hypothetical protein